nr:putative pentatricopeptide repeat-containing protein At1g64310 [Ipomoea batatas]GME13242.1 putative pentatricopeptide repeat-containing protein At1g64310 [Ipomoea batatas]
MFISFRLLLTELSRSNQTISRTKQLHAIILKTHLSHDPFYATRIIRFYALNEDIVSAHHLFDETPHRSIFLWNSIIRAYARAHRFSNAFELFKDMLDSGTRPDNFTFACILRACSDKFDFSGLRVVHGGVAVSGLELDSICSSQLVSAYSKLGRLEEAIKVFDGIAEPDLVHWNSMISGHGCLGDWKKGLLLFIKMQRMGKKPDSFTYVGLIMCLDSPSLLRIGKNVHSLCLKFGFDSNAHVASLLVSMYSRCKCMGSACRIFNSLLEPDMVTWSAMICGLSQSGDNTKSLDFFREMNTKGGKADPLLIASVLSAAAQLAIIQPGREIHGFAVRCGYHLEVSVSSALIDMYSKCGFLNLGIQVFKAMPSKNIISYNSMISNLGLHGNANEAFKIFEEVLDKEYSPDEATFSALLSACCHTGLVRDGRRYFRTMNGKFGIQPKTEHYVYMVKLLGMAGELEEAYELIQSIQEPVDSGIWGALLSCCDVHGNYRLGGIVAKHLFDNNKVEKSSYGVMVSNMYAGDGRWECVKKLRVDREAIKGKMPGKSWISNIKM